MADYASRRKALERRQKLIDAMIGGQQQISPGQMVSGHYVPAGPLQALAGVGQGIAGALMQKASDKESVALDQERASLMSEALRKAKTQEIPDQIDTYMNSGDPALQEMAMALMKESSKPESFKGLTTVRGPDGKPMLVQAGNRGSVKQVEGMLPYERPMAVRGEVLDPMTMQSYGMYGQADPGTNVNVTNFMPAQETAYSKETGKQVAGRTVDQLLVQREQVVNNFNQVQKMKQIANEGLVSGRLAPLGVFIGQTLSSFGVPVPEKLANAEQYDAAFQQPITQMILAGGRGITNEEGERIAKTWAPLWSSAEGRMKILQDLEQLQRRKFQSIEQATEHLREQRPDTYEMLQRDPAMQMSIPPIDPNAQTIPGVTPVPAGAPKPLGKFIGWEN